MADDSLKKHNRDVNGTPLAVGDLVVFVDDHASYRRFKNQIAKVKCFSYVLGCWELIDPRTDELVCCCYGMRVKKIDNPQQDEAIRFVGFEQFKKLEERVAALEKLLEEANS
jgi:hypothetical protein